MDLVRKTGQPGSVLMFSLQEERRLTAEVQTQPGSSTDALKAQRQQTDAQVRTFLASSDVSLDNVPADIKAAVTAARNNLGNLATKRSAIDGGSLDASSAYAYYTGLIGQYLEMFTSLSHVDDGTVSYLTRPLVGEFWMMEQIAREDTLLGMGWNAGQLPPDVYASIEQNFGAQAYIFNEEVSTRLPANETALIQKLGASDGWKSKFAIEQTLFKPAAPNRAGMMTLPPMSQQWRAAMDSIRPQITQLVTLRANAVLDNGQRDADSLLTKVVTTTLIGALAVLVVILVTWRLTGSLRRRIVNLQDQAGELERTLPEVVDRLARGEQVDPAAASRAIAVGDADNSGGDELDQLGQALNLARASAVGTAVRQAEQHRGFEKLLQRIARRTQLLIGLQLKTLNEMERRHEDPEVLEGLFDLDHLTARLRRYEENLVILGGGQPQRRWRKPVPLLDVLRSAQGEVQDYRRILIDVEGSPWLSERAVGPVVHVLAELMENAATFSKPPSPVEVRAALVGRGLAVEVEDRGLGMEQAQYDAANALMRSTPRMDVLAQADDVRLGLYVVARLAATLGLQVEFRPSAFGGTRAVVLIPGELVSRDPNGGYGGYPSAVPDPEPEPLPVRSAGATLTGETYEEAEAYNEFEADYSSTEYQSYDESYDAPSAETWTEPLEPVPAPRPSWAARGTDHHERTVESIEPPLPQRVRQASLAAELRTPPPVGVPAAAVEEPAPTRARSGATTIGAFQRRSRAARYEQTGEIMQFPNPAQFPAPTTEDQS